MPKSTPGKLKYMKEYNAKPERKEIGVELRRARRQAIREGKVSIGDDKDIAHKHAADNGGTASRENTEVQPSSRNRGWRKSSGYRVPNSK